MAVAGTDRVSCWCAGGRAGEQGARVPRDANEPVRDKALGLLRAAGHELDVAALPLHRGRLDDIRAGVVESHLVRLKPGTFPILGADVAGGGRDDAQNKASPASPGGAG